MIVPANRILTAQLTPTNTPLLDVVLLVYSGEVDCPQVASNLLAAADNFAAGSSETVNWTNTTAGDLEVIIVADSFTSEPAGDYVLTLALTSVLPGDICESAEAVSSGPLTGLTTINYEPNQNAGSGCAPATGPDRFFLITIPDGQTLTTTVTPTTAWDAVINILSAADECPAPATCLTGEDTAGDGGLETLQYLNTTGAALEVFIVVAGFNAGDAGPFNLYTTVAP